MTFSTILDKRYSLTFDIYSYSLNNRPFTDLRRTEPTFAVFLHKDKKSDDYIVLNAEYIENPLKYFSDGLVPGEAYKTDKLLLLQFKNSSNHEANKGTLQYFSILFLQEIKTITNSMIDV